MITAYRNLHPEPRILFLDSSSLIPVPCFPIQGKGFGNQGAKKTRLQKCKAGFDCSLIAVDFSGFLLVFECEAVEAFTNFKRYGDLINFITLCPSSEVVSLLD